MATEETTPTITTEAETTQGSPKEVLELKLKHLRRVQIISLENFSVHDDDGNWDYHSGGINDGNVDHRSCGRSYDIVLERYKVKKMVLYLTVYLVQLSVRHHGGDDNGGFRDDNGANYDKY